MTPLPRIMVAPNGAARGKADHPALPVTIPEIVDCALACRAAGADGLHAHVRDAGGRHVLDAGLYRELLSELAVRAPGLHVQVTTEAAGRYAPADQRALVETLRPAAVSVALREIARDPEPQTRRFFAFCAEAGIAVQHILYDAAEAAWLGRLLEAGTVPRAGLQVLHVLGRYAAGQKSSPADLAAPLAAQREGGIAADWAVCAFGTQETDCLLAAAAAGGKMRIGFENNLLNRDGRPARDNAGRVAELVAALAAPTAPPRNP